MIAPAPDRAPEPSPRAKLAFALAVAAGALVLTYFAQHVIFIALTGILVAIVIDALARLGVKWLRLPRTAAVIAAALVSLVVLVGGLTLIAIPLVKQGSAFAAALPERTEKLRQQLDDTTKKYPILAGVLPSMDGQSPAKAATAAEAKETVKGVAYFTSRVLEGMVSFVSIFFIAVFLAIEPERYTRGLARLLPGRSDEDWLELIHRVGDALRNYLVAMGIYIVAMAALWALGLWLIGIDYYILFGVVGGVVEIVPYVGPLLGLVPPLFVAFGMGGKTVAFVLALYAVLHVVEGYILVPLLMEKREKLPPPITLISILGFGAAFGFWGVLLAVPLATAIHVWVLHAVLEHEEPAKAPKPAVTTEHRRAA